MSDPASSSTLSSAASSSQGLGPGFCAVLVLDAEGRVTGANASARQLWQTSENELIGDAFATLFAFEVVSSDPDFLQAQWEVLLAGLGRETHLTAQPREGALRDVSVRIEKQIGPAPGYVATIQTRENAHADGSSGRPDLAESFRVLTESGAIGFFDLNLTTGSVHFSPIWKRLLGYAPSELPDTLATWHELIHPDDSAASPDKVGRKPNGGGARPFSVEFRMRHHRGHWVWMQCAGVQVINSEGVLERVVGAHLDVTDRKELEDTLVANDARLQDLSSGGPLAAFELDFVNLAFWYSPAFERLLGYQEGELAPHPASFASVLPDEDAPMGVEAWMLARAPGQNTFTEVVTLRAKDGQPVSVVLGAHRTLSRKRELLRVVGFVCGLPAAALLDPKALSAPLLETTFAAMAEAVLVVDSHGKIISANPTAARLLHMDPAAIPGQALGDVFRLVNRQSGQPGDDPVDLALSADKPLSLIGTDALSVDDRKPVPVVWTARAAYDEHGKPHGVVVVFRNPEEMTLTPEELVKANRFEALGLLAGGIAHDFNNLLTTILGAISLAKDNRDYTALGDGENACLTAKGLTKQLLAFAKGDAGMQTVCAAKDIIEHSIKIAAAGSGANINVQVTDGVSPVLVDRGQMVQVFQNLIVNALQAMPPPPHMPRLQIRAFNVTVGEQQVPGLAPGDYVEFEVRDNGSGIKPEHVEKIFDPFFTTKKHGTGLGLATVLSIVRRHGGQIGLETQVGVGTAFAVYLPKADKPLETQARRAASLRFGTGRILFMDDDAKISSLTARMLESLNYKYDLARDGEEAIALYKRYLNIGRPYDAVIMDLTVVGAMGGEECFAELRKLDPDVRAIVASGYDNDEIARSFLDKGFCGYLTKPYRVTDLGKVLKAVIG